MPWGDVTIDEHGPVTVVRVNRKENLNAINATAGALHHATALADADQSQITASFKAARAAREPFGRP
jgi:enoyl-CoA hydratase/carnithine racemase